MPIPVIDVFAGPGGLNEGFSSLMDHAGNPRFEAVGSFEMDASACKTLTLRGTLRRLRGSSSGMRAYRALMRGERTLEQTRETGEFRTAWLESAQEVHQIELGESERERANGIIRKALGHVRINDAWVLVGGPPCQAYSLAGRSRRAHDSAFEEDSKHFLYREYLNILVNHAPPVFVMENVKGLLSSTHSGTGMFHRILEDLRRPTRGLSYSIHSLTVTADPEDLSPEDFIIRSEEYGIPQRRHRVILLGIRSDLGVRDFGRLVRRKAVTVEEALGGLPALRSGLSQRPDSLEEWLAIRERAQRIEPRQRRGRARTSLDRGAEWIQLDRPQARDSHLARWLVDPSADGVAQHATRSHMAEDLMRYWFAANFALREGVSPKLGDFPRRLLPKHRNATATLRPFDDRFRVQIWSRPSTTVVSHIAKDGHYYIHPDPDQMRSLTVREAARLQTFPDDYLFLGNRTSQFSQVGNAVPPLLAHQIAGIVADLLD